MQGLRIESSPVGRIVVPASLPAGFDLFWTTRDFDGSLGEAGRERMKRALRQRGFDSDLATCAQVHGVNVVRAAPRDGSVENGSCDALWTDEGPLSIAIKVADCLPVLIVDSGTGLIGGAHAGWRGMAENVVGALHDSIDRAGRLRTAQWKVWLGPAIRRCCFEVGEEVVERFAARWPEVARWTDRSRGPRPFLDLAGMAAERLRRAGVPPEAVFDSELCTRCHDSMFHSYRRDGSATGRNLAVVSRQ